MKICVLCLILTLVCMYSCLAQGSYENCCLKYNKEPKQRIKIKAVDYRIQENDGGCNIRAVVFIFPTKKTFCADPREKWVQRWMKNMDKKLYSQSQV